MIPTVPILDNHMHLDPRGHGVEAAQRFEEAGGTHLILVHKPYNHLPREDFEGQYQVTLDLAREVRRDTGLVVHIALSPHPAELTNLTRRFPLEQAKETLRKAIDLAADHIREGRAMAFGEAGRPHYPVNEYVWDAANELIEYTISLAKELDCAVQFHTEGGEGSFRDIAYIARKVGYPLERCVKHFSGPSVLEEENSGLFPSVVARRSSIKKAISKGNRFFMETDYIDELSRPNIVLPPTTVPVLTLKYLRNGLFTEEDAFRIHKDHAERIYGIEIEFA
jgi:TatD-related deoxyribonuclease